MSSDFNSSNAGSNFGGMGAVCNSAVVLQNVVRTLSMHDDTVAPEDKLPE